MNKLRKMLLGCIIGLSILSLTGCGSTTIDLNKYITIEAEGYDSMGTLRYNFDYDKFEKDCDGKIKANVKSNDGGTAAEIAMELGFGATVPETLFGYCVNYKVNKSSELSNGDKVTLKWDCKDEDAKKYFNCKLKYSDIEYTVKGLDEVPSFDPFEYVKVEFSGVAPQGFVEIAPDYDKSEMQYLSFEADHSSELSNGDVVTVTARVQYSTEDFVERFGKIPEPCEKTFTVEGLQKYVSSSAEIDSSTLNAMKQQAEDIFMASLVDEGWKSDELQGFTYLGNYFLYLKEGFYGDANFVVLVHKVDAKWEEKFYTYYYPVIFRNLMIGEDGSCSIDLSGYELSSHRYSIDPDNWFSAYYNNGYASLEELYEDKVQSQIASYTYENNVND